MLDTLLGLAIVGNLLPLGAEFWWVLELTSHFRLQIVVVDLLLIAIALFRRRRLLGAGLLAAAALNFWPLVAYLPSGIATPVAQSFTVLNVNVNARNANHAAILGTIERSGADFVTLIELSEPLAAELETLSAAFPYQISYPTNDNFGIALLSRYPLIEQPLSMLGPSRAIAARVDLSGTPLEIIAVHPLPPRSRTQAATRNRQLELLADYIGEAEDNLVVCGDFNLSPYSPHFSRFETAAGVVSARRGLGIGISWPTGMPLLGTAIDHCFSRGALGADRVERLDPIGSDHYPVRVTFGY